MDITFDRETHVYRVDSRKVDSVTQILEILAPYAGVHPDILEAARQLGTNVHLTTELHDRGDLDEERLDPLLLFYLDGWKNFLSDTGFTITHIEEIVYSKTYNYIGTFDRAGILNGKECVLDIKTTAFQTKTHPLQLAAYAQAFKESGGFQSPNRYTLRLTPAYPRGYRLEQHEGKLDLSNFLACLTVHNLKKR